MTAQKTTQRVYELDFLAEVEVELVPDDGAWGPYLSPADVERLDEVRRALRSGDLATASRLARVFRLVPVNAA